MTVRPMRYSDIPALEAMATASGFPYPDLRMSRNVESIMVVADDQDRPMMAAVAERLVQIYLYCGEFKRPLAKAHAMRMLHESMMEALSAKGYHGAEAYIPPTLCKRFARRLEKTFGWRPNWPSWNRSF